MVVLFTRADGDGVARLGLRLHFVPFGDFPIEAEKCSGGKYGNVRVEEKGGADSRLQRAKLETVA